MPAQPTRSDSPILFLLVVIALLLPIGLRTACAQQPAPRVQINEFMAAPDSGAPEYVELAIGGTSPLATDRLALRDATSAWRLLPTEAQPLLPGDFVVITPDTSLFRAWLHNTFPARMLPLRMIELRPWPALNNAGDSLALSLDGFQLERLGYASEQVERGRSLERLQALLPAHAAANWVLPLSGAGSPGLPNTVFRVDTTAPAVLGVEQIDPTTLRLYFSEPLLPVHVRALQVRFSGDGPSGTVALSGLTAEPDAFVTAHIRLPIPLSGLTLGLTGMRDPSGNEAAPSTHPVHGLPAAGELMITEVMLRGSPDFVEILVSTDRHLSLGNVKLSRSEGTSEPIAKASSEAAHLVSPGQILVIEATLSTSGETLVLGTSGAVMDSVMIGSDMEDVRFRNHSNRSLVRIGPGPTDWASSLSQPSTPGQDTTADLRRVRQPDPTAHALTLTEVLYDPLTDASDGLMDQVEFLEWTNDSPVPVSLFGAFMTWEINERGTSDTLRLGYQPVLLPPGATVVAFQMASHRAGSENAAQLLKEIWPDTPHSVISLPVRRSLGLLNTGRAITLHARDQTVLAHGTYSPDDHHPAVISGKGRALVRLRTNAGFAPWTTSTAPGGASPGRVESGVEGDPNGPLAADHDPTHPSAHLSPRSFYPEHPELGGRTLIHVHVPVSTGPRVVRVQVRDLHAHVVRVLSRGLLVQGFHTLVWDGQRDDGTLLPAGPYVVEIVVTSPGDSVFRLPVALLRR